MQNRIRTLLTAALLATAAACGTAPTAPAATAGDLQANTTPPADSTGGRTPNMFGSGN